MTRKRPLVRIQQRSLFMKINNEKEYSDALKRVDEIFLALPGSPEWKELLELVEQVDKYETEHYPMDRPTTDL